ncbi:hypothetical protein [Caldicellulosiruptor naganoensis]|nr:hypothetical protein [Caldicellulosiruptor naganoensis]
MLKIGFNGRYKVLHFTDGIGGYIIGRLVKNFVFPIYNVSCKVGLCY